MYKQNLLLIQNTNNLLFLRANYDRKEVWNINTIIKLVTILLSISFRVILF